MVGTKKYERPWHLRLKNETVFSRRVLKSHFKVFRTVFPGPLFLRLRKLILGGGRGGYNCACLPSSHPGWTRRTRWADRTSYLVCNHREPKQWLAGARSLLPPFHRPKPTAVNSDSGNAGSSFPGPPPKLRGALQRVDDKLLATLPPAPKRKNDPREEAARPQTPGLTCGMSMGKLSREGTWLSPPSWN